MRRYGALRRLVYGPQKSFFHFFSFSSTSSVDSLSVYLSCVLQKVMRRSQHARKETEFLRLKRTRLGLDDFESLKVIGRGAFGEVRWKKSVPKLL